MENYKEPLKLAFIGGSIDSAIGYTHYIASQMDHLFVLTAGCFSRNDEINKKRTYVVRFLDCLCF